MLGCFCLFCFPPNLTPRRVPVWNRRPLALGSEIKCTFHFYTDGSGTEWVRIPRKKYKVDLSTKLLDMILLSCSNIMTVRVRMCACPPRVSICCFLLFHVGFVVIEEQQICPELHTNFQCFSVILPVITGSSENLSSGASCSADCVGE